MWFIFTANGTECIQAGFRVHVQLSKNIRAYHAILFSFLFINIDRWTKKFAGFSSMTFGTQTASFIPVATSAVLAENGFIFRLIFGIAQSNLTPFSFITYWTAATPFTLAWHRFMALSSVKTNWYASAILWNRHRLVFHVNPVFYPISIFNRTFLANFVLTISADVVSGAFAIYGLSLVITAAILLAFSYTAWIVWRAMVEIGIVYDLIFAI